MTTVATAQAIVDAADAWLLKNLGTHDAVFSTSSNGVAVQVRGYDEVLKLRARYARLVSRLQNKSRTLARFEDS